MRHTARRRSPRRSRASPPSSPPAEDWSDPGSHLRRPPPPGGLGRLRILGRMFRTARGFLLVSPPAFVLVLVSFLVSHARAAEAFVPYPFLSEAMGQGFAKRPVFRFTISAIFFFLLPYLVTGLLLFFADLGVS